MRMQKKHLHNPYYLLLFPVFFVLHGFTENFYFVSIQSALLLALKYVVASTLITFIFFLLFGRKIRAAGLITLFILSFYFFFGNVYDTLFTYFGDTFIIRYSFLSILFVILCILLVLFLRKKQKLFSITVYLNLLFILLILIDLGSLSITLLNGRQKNNLVPVGFLPCDKCPKPDIYLIILDGYAGSGQLKNQFHFDNSSFTEQLASRGFKTISDSRSNYNYTPFSTASMLNMAYLDSSKIKDLRRVGNRYASDQINNNVFISLLKAYGYSFYNHSVFKVAGQASPTGGSFVPANAKLVNGNTFFSRLQKDVIGNIDAKFLPRWYLKELLYQTDKDNRKVYDLTWKITSEHEKPKVVFTHLMMPHHPYYYDENGQQVDFGILYKMPMHSPGNYISYLKYTNKKMLSLIDHLFKTSSTSPVIILASDHGYRHAENDPNYAENIYSSILSVHLPDRDYTAFPDTMSNVNMLRAVLNSTFEQRLPDLEERRYFIKF
jgi:hypothetical protein